MSNPVHIDRELARQILAGDERAFRQLFDSFFPRLYRFALVRLRGDHDAADEVVQRTFCKAIERLDSYRGEAALYTWFCQICRNTLIDHCRRRGADARHVTLLEDVPDLRSVLDAITAGPAFVRNGRMDLLAVNPLARAFYKDCYDMPGQPPFGVARPSRSLGERAHQPLPLEGDDLAAGKLNDREIVFE